VASLSVTITIKDLRGPLGALGGMGVGRLNPSNPSAVVDAFKDLLSLTGKLSLSIKVDPGLASGSLEVDATHLDTFLHGYMTVVGLMQEANTKQQLSRAHSPAEKMFIKWMSLIQKRTSDLNAASFKALAESGATSEQSISVNLEAKGPDVTVSLNGKSDTNNIERATAALKAAGFPTIDKGGVVFSVKTENGNLVGNFYVSVLGNAVDSLKSLLVAPAQADAELKATADLLANLQLKDAKMVGGLKDQKLALSGYVETSDLTPTAKAALAQAAPKLSATPDGARIEASAANGKGEVTVKLHFKDFMPGKSAQDITSSLGADPSALKVEVDAAGDKISLGAALTKPAVSMPSTLASVKASGDAMVAVAPSGSAAGSSKTTIAIVAGAVVLLLIAGAASRKSA
jgi:hypothetical protein